MTFDFDFEMRIRAPRAVVFERLLRIEHLARWFCGWSRIEPKVGGTFKFGGETCIVLPEKVGWETTIDEGEVLRRFAFTWPIQGTLTRVSHELEDAGTDTTLLRTRHRDVPIRDSTCGTMQDAWRMCLGNLKSIAEGRGDSVRPDHSAVALPEMRISALVEARPTRVFEALTNPAEVDEWSTGGVPSGKTLVDARPGGAFVLGWKEGPDKILQIDPNNRLVLDWRRPQGDLRFSVNLEEKASGTAIYIASTGYRSDESNAILEHRGRWSDLLVCLKNHVESGTAGFANPYSAQMRAN